MSRKAPQLKRLFCKDLIKSLPQRFGLNYVSVPESESVFEPPYKPEMGLAFLPGTGMSVYEELVCS